LINTAKGNIVAAFQEEAVVALLLCHPFCFEKNPCTFNRANNKINNVGNYRQVRKAENQNTA
jgi:hypothetical protein